jgi:membrane protein
VGGIAWQTAGWVFALFIASSNNYAAIYASFAILILFMIWLYLSWLVLLFGASVAFYVQHPEYLYLRGGEPRLSNRMRELLALASMELVARRFIHGDAAPSQQVFTEHLKVPGHVLMVVLDELERKAMVVATADDPCLYLPARNPARILLADVLEAVRAADEDGFLSPSAVPTSTAVDGLVAQLQQAAATSLAGMSLHDLVQQGDAPQADPSPTAPA